MMKNFPDIENLSAYLDGKLSQADSARLEARLKSDPELDSILNDLRAARSLLRGLPSRKAPRNFTLTRQMVGLKPPLPRSYPAIRFATVFAAILFLCSFTANALTPMISFGFGGAAAPEPVLEMGAAATEAPATEEAFAVEMAPAATEAPPSTEETPAQQDMATLPTATPDSARIAPTPSLKENETQPTAESEAPGTENQPEVPTEPPRSFNWTLAFFVIAIAGGTILWVMRLSARNKWR